MNYDFDQFFRFGHYGIFREEDAFYPEVRKLLKEALESGEDFDTGWGSFKKELESIRIQAIGNTITVSVACYMDEFPDLIYDCDNAEDLTDFEVSEITDNWHYSDYTTDVTKECELPRDSSVLDILSAATDLCIECNNWLKEGFQSVQNSVDYMIAQRRESEA